MSRVYHGLSSVAPVRSLFVIARRAPDPQHVEPMWASLSPWLAYLSIEGALARRCRAPCCGGASARAHAKAVDGESLVASSLVDRRPLEGLAMALASLR